MMPLPLRRFMKVLTLLSGLSFLPALQPPGRADEVTEYGSSQQGAGLIGIMYDCKQNQKSERMPMDNQIYDHLLNEFLSSNWDEDILNRYFRVTRALYTTQIFIPLSSADRAPQAFGVAKFVKPEHWMIHYKGQVAPPTTGLWRFWGYGSEICSVAVNGKTVLSSNWIEDRRLHPIATPDLDWKSSAPPGRPVHRGLLTAGTWMSLKKGAVVDLDVLIGERGGGSFCAVLLIEKEGDRYEMQGGYPVFPIFQLAPHDTPDPHDPKRAPPFSPNGPVWKSIQ